jgi:hypothetical protein
VLTVCGVLACTTGGEPPGDWPRCDECAPTIPAWPLGSYAARMRADEAAGDLCSATTPRRHAYPRPKRKEVASA